MHYEEIFSPIAIYASMRAIIYIASNMEWGIHQMGVNIAFLNGVIEEEVYLVQPQGFKVHASKSHVCKLMKALYKHKQSPRAWYSRIDG